MKKILASLKVPKGKDVKIYEHEYTWRKRGGHAGDKTISKIVENAKALGWKLKKVTSSETPDGSNQTSNSGYVSPCGNYMMRTNSHYGVTADYNSYSIRITSIEPKN